MSDQMQNTNSSNVRATIDELKKMLLYITKGYKVPKIVYDVIMRIAKLEIEGNHKVVLIKRDPDVEGRRMQAAFVKIIEGETLELYPAQVSGFGADFDGDSVKCDIKIYKRDLNTNELVSNIINIEDFLNHVNYKFDCTNVYNDNKTITKYIVLDEVYIDSINCNTGKVSLQKISNFSVHDNLVTYKIKSKKNDFNEFYCSADHSLVVYDDIDKKIVRIDPVSLSLNSDRYYLIKNRSET